MSSVKLDQIMNISKSKKVASLKDAFRDWSDNPRLIISPSNKCDKRCTHCVSDATPNGPTMKYSDFIKIDNRFFEIFRSFDFGRTGDPMLYHSEGNNFADLAKHLLNFAPTEITIASGCLLAVKNTMKN